MTTRNPVDRMAEDDAEARRAREDLVRAERTGQSPAPLRTGILAPGYVRGVHPEHGEAVVFTPGEMLPEWAAEQLAAGKSTTDPATGATVLPGTPAPDRRRSDGRDGAYDATSPDAMTRTERMQRRDRS